MLMRGQPQGLPLRKRGQPQGLPLRRKQPHYLVQILRGFYPLSILPKKLYIKNLIINQLPIIGYELPFIGYDFVVIILL